MSQQFCLKWNNHMSNMMDVFKNLLSTEAMVDVTLACDGLSLKAHKIVLSACSPFFQSLFLENPCKHPIVILKDMKYTELKAIIEFMYHGEVNVAQDQLSALMKTAETLRVKGLAEVTNEKNQSGDESSHRSVSRTDTPPPKRRRGRTRKRSMSDQSDDGASEPKIKQPDSDIEELSGDMDPSTPYSTASTVPLQSHSTNSFHKSQQEQQPVEQGADESFAAEEKFAVEPSKLLEQTLTTDDLPRRSGRSSVQSNMELQRRPRSSTDHSSSIVPVTSTPMSSDALVVANQQPESPPDIKPELLDLEPPMSPVAGPSHSADENSMMMYMDQSSMSNMPGPSGYQDNSALVSTDSQPQESEVKKLKGNQALIWNTISTIVNSNEANTKQLGLILSALEKLSKSDEEESEESVLLASLPANCEEFMKLNEQIVENSSFRKTLLQIFMASSGKEARVTATNCLRKLMTDDVAENYSLTGKHKKAGPQKNAFEKTPAYQVLTDACVRIHKGVKESVIREAISDWLMQAKFRKSRREKRTITVKVEEFEEADVNF